MSTPVERIEHAKKELSRYVKEDNVLEETAIRIAESMWQMGRDVCEYDMLELIDPKSNSVHFYWIKHAKKAANNETL